jgi:3-methyladenine DNA glycosylase AlkC
MKTFKHDKTMSVLYQRALSLSISKEFADKKKGKMFAVAKQDSEQEERRRELLAIEQEAEKRKNIKRTRF